MLCTFCARQHLFCRADKTDVEDGQHNGLEVVNSHNIAHVEWYNGWMPLPTQCDCAK